MEYVDEGTLISTVGNRHGKRQHTKNTSTVAKI